MEYFLFTPARFRRHPLRPLLQIPRQRGLFHDNYLLLVKTFVESFVVELKEVVKTRTSEAATYTLGLLERLVKLIISRPTSVGADLSRCSISFPDPQIWERFASGNSLCSGSKALDKVCTQGFKKPKSVCKEKCQRIVYLTKGTASSYQPLASVIESAGLVHSLISISARLLQSHVLQERDHATRNCGRTLRKSHKEPCRVLCAFSLFFVPDTVSVEGYK